jgi:hypothetical protein
MLYYQYTWDGCSDMALFTQLDRDGNQWAYLCEKHHKLLDSALSKPVASAMLIQYDVICP